jgi:cation-transporting ATPase E
MELKGLTTKEVEERIANNQVNTINNTNTKTIKEIFLSNIFTYFNILNLVLAGAIIVSGIIFNRFFYSLKNCLFLGVIICNTTISIVQEILSKKTIDKLSIISSIKPKVLRDGNIISVTPEEIVMDDIIKYEIGSQIVVDSVILTDSVEVNESAITGEAKTILKTKGDTLLSGSFIVSGSTFAKVIHIKEDNYINTISQEAKKMEKSKSVIFNSFEKLVRILSYILVPLGIALFLSQYLVVNSSLSDSIINTVAALIGMIPEGLVLLTSSVMAVSVVKLSREKVLVQQLYCIETLARVNVICLDKTGTITTGNMKVNSIISKNNNFENTIIKVLKVLPDNSGTFLAIRDKFKQKTEVNNCDIIPFSSERKYSACKIDDTSYYVGAPEYVLASQKELIDEEITNKQNDYRILVIASRRGELVKKPTDLKVEGYILIEDEIRREAKDTLEFFKEQGVIVKIISGDNYKTVTQIARKVGLKNLNGIDCTDLTDDNLDEIVKNNDVFGRVTPHMKKKLVMALKRNGYTVAMTGDGVNDVLALREADCSVAMASGSDAAKSVSQLVLLDSNFASMPKIVAEGRRNINNIERSSSLLLVKTIYTILLILTCIVTSNKYFFVPIQLTLITSCTIGIPSFILALEPNHNLVDGKSFLVKIIKKSLPGGLTVMLNGIIILLFKRYFEIDENVINALAVLITGITGFIHLAYVSRPFNYLRGIMFALLLLAFSYGVLFQNEFFVLKSFNGQIGLIFFLLVIFSIFAYNTLVKVVDYLFDIKNKLKKNL